MGKSQTSGQVISLLGHKRSEEIRTRQDVLGQVVTKQVRSNQTKRSSPDKY